ncbi:MAG: hypothetical protein HOP02_07145 [Methylococcaceae bacterium]|nr:hypothetical protein [Methylococcaceae bacterium]
MTLLVNLKRLSNPRIRRRLKIALSVWIGAMLLAVSYKVVYDIGHFDAKSLESTKNANGPIVPLPKLSLEAAQKIVTGALREDPSAPKTFVTQVLDDDHKLATLMIEKDKQKSIAWIIDMRLFFKADLLDHEGYNLTEGFEKQYEINGRGNY